MSNSQPLISPPCMPTFKPSIILCSLILSTLQDSLQSLPPSPGILAHGHLTRTHQLLQCDLTVHTQATREYQGWMRCYRAFVPNIWGTNPLHSTSRALQLAWGLAWVTSSINGSPPHLCPVTRPPIPFWINTFKWKRSMSKWTKDPSL